MTDDETASLEIGPWNVAEPGKSKLPERAQDRYKLPWWTDLNEAVYLAAHPTARERRGSATRLRRASVDPASRPRRGRPPRTGLRVTRRLLLGRFWTFWQDNDRLPTQRELADACDEAPLTTLRDALKREGLRWDQRERWPRD
jgi:hypothetical protein